MSNITENITTTVVYGQREGVPIEKGFVLNEAYLRENFEHLKDLFQFFSAYPDLFLDIITPEDENMRLFFYQRIFLRVAMRFRVVFVTACRAWSKSFLTILALIIQCVLIPGRKVFICAPNKTQGAQIAKEKIYEIYRHWPLLAREVIGGDISDTPGNFGKDYVTLKFRNGSQFDVVGALESSLGGRRHGGLIDEIKNHDETMINTVVLPLLNVSRRGPDNEINPNEPNQQVIAATSAWQKTSFAYNRLIDNFETAIIDPDKAFVLGCDYRVPMLHGLIERSFINDLKMSPSFNETTFATEYLSYWQGASAESWVNMDRLNKYRKLKNPETHAIFRAHSEQFYLLSVDVGRIHDQTVVTVFRVNISKDNLFATSVVNIIVLGRDMQSKTFTRQALDIKKLIELYDPKEVVIDTNGLGVGLADEMIKPSYDTDGKYYPPYGFTNDENYQNTQPKDAICILYGLKANGPLKSKIHGNVYAKIAGGSLRFLIPEQEAKTALLATKVGQTMTIEQRTRRLMGHEMTTRLFEEMVNFRFKRTGSNSDIVLEPINSRYPDDKYMSFAYGLWRIKEIEEERQRFNRRRHGGLVRQLTFFTGDV